MTSSSLVAARDALARGDVLIAYDLAENVVQEQPDDLEARYLVALSLARAGSTERAGVEAAELCRRAATTAASSIQLLEDADALLARLAKDRAFAAEGADRTILAREAAALYEVVADRYDRSYSCVNAASLWLIAGDSPRAHRLAAHTLELAREEDDLDPYWRAATIAEAALVLGDETMARAALADAAAVEPVDLGARAATRRQLHEVRLTIGLPDGITDVLEVPSALHYCGHMAIDPPDLPDGVAVEVGTFLDRRHVGFAYGALAAGADTVIAEAILDRDIELHVVLPFDLQEFVEVSVAPAGASWVERFDRCLERRDVRDACVRLHVSGR